jgi:carbon storage regulator
MLVLTRKAGESLRIGNNIILTILEKSSGAVRLGIEAPFEIPIYREEIYQRLQEANRNAVVSGKMELQMLKHIMGGK